MKAGERVHVIVLVDPLPHDERQPFIVFVGEPLLEIQELIDSTFRQVCCKGLEAGPKELQGVLEHEVIAKGEGEILLHPLPNYLDVVPSEVLEGQADEVRVVPPEVVEKHRNFAGTSQAEITPPMCCPAIHPRHLIVVPDLLLGTVEGFVADVTVLLYLVPPIHEVVVPESLLIVVKLHRLVRELQHVLQEPMEAAFPDAGLEPALELSEGGEDGVPDCERRLTLVVKRLVGANRVLIPGRSGHRLEVCVREPVRNIFTSL